MMVMMSHEKKEIIDNLMLEVALQDTSIPFMGEGTEYFMLQKFQIMASLMGHLVQMEIYIHTLNLCTMKSPIRHKIFRITMRLSFHQSGCLIQVKIPKRDKHRTAIWWLWPLYRGGCLIIISNKYSVCLSKKSGL